MDTDGTRALTEEEQKGINPARCPECDAMIDSHYADHFHGQLVFYFAKDRKMYQCTNCKKVWVED